LTVVIDESELQTLRDLAGTEAADVANVAGEVLRAGLAVRPERRGRAREGVAAQPVDGTTDPAAVDEDGSGAGGKFASLRRDPRVKRGGALLAALAGGVLLVGGYVLRWQWTGFPSNGQLWDWMNLLLLPVALATLPIWLKHGDRMGRVRQRAFAGFLLFSAGFVAAGYLVPLGWTGFSGNTLWDWLTLILLPATIITVVTWPKTGRAIRREHLIVLGLLLAGCIVTIIGGYEWGWAWTGYQGNTLWDWVQLTLTPSVVAVLLLPTAVGFVSGNVVKRVEEEEERVEARYQSCCLCHSARHGRTRDPGRLVS